MSAGMIVAARVPSAPPFLSPVSSFINYASLNARAPPGLQLPPVAPPFLKPIAPPVSLKPMAPALFAGARFVAPRFLALFGVLFTGVLGSLWCVVYWCFEFLVKIQCLASIHDRSTILLSKIGFAAKGRYVNSEWNCHL